MSDTTGTTDPTDPMQAAIDAINNASGSTGTTAGKPVNPKPKVPIGGNYARAQVTNQNTPGLRQADLVPDPEANVLGVRPGYFEGDDWSILQGKSPEDVAQIQVLLVNAGLLSNDIPIGAWEQKSATAFRKVLELANRTGVDWGTALLNYASTPTLKDLTGGSTRAPLTVRLSNPDDLKSVFKQAAYNQLGGKGFVDDAQTQRFVDTYHEQESKAQRAAYNAAGSGGTVTDAPQADTAALDQLKTEDPAAYQASQFATYGRQIRDLLSGSGA